MLRRNSATVCGTPPWHVHWPHRTNDPKAGALSEKAAKKTCVQQCRNLHGSSVKLEDKSTLVKQNNKKKGGDETREVEDPGQTNSGSAEFAIKVTQPSIPRFPAYFSRREPLLREGHTAGVHQVSLDPVSRRVTGTKSAGTAAPRASRLRASAR